MPSIPYVATVSDPTGKRREFNVPVSISKRQLNDLRDRAKGPAVLKHIAETAQVTIMAERWACVICQRRATRMVTTPAFCPTPK